jgi:adenine-specific DNA-methyltransferase
MNGELEVLVDKVGDPSLRAALRERIERIEDRRSYGLVFEDHLPERVCLPDHPIRVGSKVALRADAAGPNFVVTAMAKGRVTVAQTRHPDGSSLTDDEAQASQPTTVEVGDLVVVAEFGDPIYPGMRVLGSVERGGHKPHHVVIKGDNHHVLEAMQFTHAGRVDVIYIDPPYNTGDGDWKYDNDYVDKTDKYRHSKFLAFMERRLKLAESLLNPDRAVLIVTIDEREVLRLGLLLEQLFPHATHQMVSTVISPTGASRKRQFRRSDEYVFVVLFGEAAVVPVEAWSTSVTAADPEAGPKPPKLTWNQLMRSGTGSARSDRPNGFYPIYVSEDGTSVVGVGDPLPEEADRHTHPSAKPPDGAVTIWPIRKGGSEGRWQISGAAVLEAHRNGHLKLGSFTANGMAITYLKAGEKRKIEDGVFRIVGRGPSGEVIVEPAAGEVPRVVPTTNWNVQSHAAAYFGTQLLSKFLPDRDFPFPKSLYAVEDVLWFFLGDRPDSVVLDFFGGSGTTAHAVARINRRDGGRRQCILVTNNEVSQARAEKLAASGVSPGEWDWERHGIFEEITRPRVEAAITGSTPAGDPVEGDYGFVDEFPMADGLEENVLFAELTFEDPNRIELDLAFEAVAPLLWLRAGAVGPVIAERGVDDHVHAITEHYGVLFDSDRWRSFIAELPDTVRTVFIVTDSAATFSQVSAELPTGVDAVRLYENYLTTFRYGGQGT